MSTQPTRLLVLLLAILAGSACHHGVRPETFVPANGPAGARATMRVEGEKGPREGELFAADSIGIIVRTDRLIRVAWDDIARLDLAQLGRDFAVAPNERITPAKRQRLALVSRFPNGLDGAVLARVLATLNQESIDELEPSGSGGGSGPNGRSEPGPFAQPLPLTSEMSIDDLAAAADRATERYADRRIAIADGYRRIGTDFPAMGEHWVLAAALLEGRVDSARPTLLTYASIDGRPTLLGTGFVMSTRGDARPESVPGWPAEWHEHSGFIAEESGAHPATNGHRHVRSNEATSGTRVWVLHIWTALANPAGTYRANNWSLPFARAGITPHAHPDEAAGRALSLTVGGAEFLRAVLTDAGLRTGSNATVIDAAIGAARAEAASVADQTARFGGAATAHLASLRAAWESLCEALVRAAGPAAMQYLADARH